MWCASLGREGEVMWISPSGYSLADAEPEDYVAVDIASGEPRAPMVRVWLSED